MVNMIRALDPSRLISNANTYYPETAHLMPHMDVVSYNLYPAWYYFDLPDGVKKEIDTWTKRAVEMLGEERPFLISELGAEAIYGWRDRHEARWSEEYQVKVLEEACKETMANPRIAGLAIWTFCDFRSTESMDDDHSHVMRRARGFNNKGVVDEYRRRKLSYPVVKDYFHRINPS